MPAPSPRMKPSRSRSNGRLARVGSSLRVERAVRRLKPVTPNGWIMLCVPPESITSASPRRMISVRLADRLRAGGAGGQAVGVRPPGAEEAGEVAGGRARLLLGLVDRVELLQPLAGELGRVDLARRATSGGPARRTGGSPAAPRPSRGRRRTGSGRGPSTSRGPSRRWPSGRRRWRTGCSGSTRPSARRRRCSRPGRSPLASAAIRVGKVSGVEQRDRADAAPALPAAPTRSISRSRPTGVTIPIPVTTTRRMRAVPSN